MKINDEIFKNPASQGGAVLAAMIGKLVNKRYGREDGLESDRLAVKLTREAGNNFGAMIQVMHILGKASG